MFGDSSQRNSFDSNSNSFGSNGFQSDPVDSSSVDRGALSNSGSPDGVDAEYRFGRPKVYLTPHQLARLTIIRSRLGDTRAEREAEHIIRRSAGNLD